MRTYADQRMGDVMQLASRASDELQQDQHQQSLRSFRQLTGRLERMNLTSAWATWGTAVSLDHLGELVMAFEMIQMSLRLDPLSPTTLRSFEVMTQRLRDAVLKADPADASVPKLYALLQASDEADVPTHLAMVRHLMTAGQLDRAASLAQAVTVLAPSSRDAWQARANVARLQKDEAAAAGFEAEALMRSLDAVPYAPVAKQGVKE